MPLSSYLGINESLSREREVCEGKDTRPGGVQLAYPGSQEPTVCMSSQLHIQHLVA